MLLTPGAASRSARRTRKRWSASVSDVDAGLLAALVHGARGGQVRARFRQGEPDGACELASGPSRPRRSWSRAPRRRNERVSAAVVDAEGGCVGARERLRLSSGKGRRRRRAIGHSGSAAPTPWFVFRPPPHGRGLRVAPGRRGAARASRRSCRARERAPSRRRSNLARAGRGEGGQEQGEEGGAKARGAPKKWRRGYAGAERRGGNSARRRGAARCCRASDVRNVRRLRREDPRKRRGSVGGAVGEEGVWRRRGGGGRNERGRARGRTATKRSALLADAAGRTWRE